MDEAEAKNEPNREQKQKVSFFLLRFRYLNFVTHRVFEHPKPSSNHTTALKASPWKEQTEARPQEPV
jgi:hypothetical protein